MKYISTRGDAPVLNFEQVVTSGLAADGGLYVPENVPQFSAEEIESWRGLAYQEIAEKVMSPFIGDEIPADDLRELIHQSYATFRTPDIAPLHKLYSKEYILELFHGPTLAFKDFALQFLGNLLDYILERRKQDVIIIGATSGDTGSAAIEGCHNCKHVQLFMLHPAGRVSDVQRRQMTTVLADNIHNIAMETDFDGCQSMVKQLFREGNFAGKPLVAVNSINWARIMAQIVYYFYAGLQLNSPHGEQIFSVPTGNFGDIYAGYMAHKMGLPIRKLIVATNKNDILHRFFKSNDYSKTTVTPTLSPSMDIQISSNFERLLFDLHGRNGAKVAELMENFNSSGKLSVAPDILEKAQEIFDSYTADDNDIRTIIKETYNETGYLLDPHTATGVFASNAIHKPDENNPDSNAYPRMMGENTVVLATAHPAKFPDVAQETLGITPELPAHLVNLMQSEERYTTLPNNTDKVREFILQNSFE